MGDRYDMTAEQVLSYMNQKGIILTLAGNSIKYKAPTGVMTPDLAEMIKMHRQGILGILNPDRAIKSISTHLHEGDSQVLLPGDCDSCPAGGFWEFKGPNMWCFHSAYFLGKAAKPIQCEIARGNCPLKN